jgi:integrase
MTMQDQVNATRAPLKRVPWNKGKVTGAKPPLRPKHVWSIRTKFQIERRSRDLAMFNLAIDSKLRGCDVVAIRVEDVTASGYTADRATVRQTKTGRPVRFELSEQTRQGLKPPPNSAAVQVLFFPPTASRPRLRSQVPTSMPAS